MKCKNCGAEVKDKEMKFCPACGKEWAVTSESTPAAAGKSKKDGYDEKKDITTNKTMAALSYLLFFLPLVTEPAKTSKFARFHANQSLVLWIFYVGAIIITQIINAIFYASFSIEAYFVWAIFNLLWYAVYVVFAIFAILNGIAAYNGKWKKVPIIGKITIIK